MIEKTIYYMCGMLEVYIWMYCFCGCEMRHKKQKIMYIFLVMLGIWIQSIIYVQTSIIGEIIGAPLLALIIFQGPIKDIILRWFFSYFYISIISDPIHCVFNLICIKENNIHLNTSAELTMELICIGIILLLSKFLQTTSFAQESRWKFDNIYYWIGLVLGISASGITAFVTEMLSKEGRQISIVIYVLLSILVELIYLFGIYLFYIDIMRKRYKQQVMLKEKYLEVTRAYYKTVNCQMKDIRKIKHEMNQHFTILGNYIRHNKYDQALAYIEHTHEKISEVGAIFDVGNDLINAVITQIQGESGINLVCSGDIRNYDRKCEEDLCIVVANILKNAVENCPSDSEAQKWIDLSFRMYGDKVVVACINPVSEEIDVGMLKGGYTKKDDKYNHGMGLDNVRDIVKKYDGMINMECCQKKFKIQIVM